MNRCGQRIDEPLLALRANWLRGNLWRGVTEATLMAIAYFSTWTTYGTWLPGDERGWFAPGQGLADPDALRRWMASLCMAETSVSLDLSRRSLVQAVIADHCRLRGWSLHAVNCRTNHVHVVVFAPGEPIARPREQFKSWTTRKLKADCPSRHNWWTERGWDAYLDNDRALHDAVAYVLEGQDQPR